MKITLPLLATVLSSLPVQSAYPYDSANDLEHRAARLAESSSRSKEKCEAFNAEYQALAKDWLPEGTAQEGPTPKSLEDTLRAWNLAKRFPGGDPSPKDYSNLIADLASSGAEPDGKFFSAIYTCSSLAFWETYQGVFRGGELYGFKSTLKRAVARQFFSQAAAELEKHPSLISLLMFTQFSRQLVKQGWLEVSDAAAIELSHLEANPVSLKTRVRRETRSAAV